MPEATPTPQAAPPPRTGSAHSSPPEQTPDSDNSQSISSQSQLQHNQFNGTQQLLTGHSRIVRSLAAQLELHRLNLIHRRNLKFFQNLVAVLVLGRTKVNDLPFQGMTECGEVGKGDFQVDGISEIALVIFYQDIIDRYLRRHLVQLQGGKNPNLNIISSHQVHSFQNSPKINHYHFSRLFYHLYLRSFYQIPIPPKSQPFLYHSFQTQTPLN